MSIQRPPFWHRSEISMPGKTDRQGEVHLSCLGGYSGAPDTEFHKRLRGWDMGTVELHWLTPGMF